MAIRYWFLPMLLCVIACTPPNTTVTLLSSSTFPPKPPNCELQIFTEAPKNTKYVEIAILNTVAYGKLHPPFATLYMNSNDKDLNAMLPSIKAAACKLGADGILIKTVEAGIQTDPESFGKAYTVAIKFIN